MPEHEGLMRIFWPTDLPRSDLRGVVVGWRNSALDVVVVAILEEVEVCPSHWQRYGRNRADID
jgi:phosphatidylinositol glycan class Q protein